MAEGRMTWDEVLYRVVAVLLNVNIWGGELIGAEDLPANGSAVFVANHAHALGPIAVTSSLPTRVYPWVVGDMLTWEAAPAYLNQDFVEPVLHLKPPLGRWISAFIAHFSVSLLRTVQCIPVWHGDRLLETYCLSLDYLERGRSLLIFPEDPLGPVDRVSGMRPFKSGFAHLGELYFETRKRILRFYPLAVHERMREVRVGPSVAFNPYNERVRERARLTTVLQKTIRSMLVDMSGPIYAVLPLPH